MCTRNSIFDIACLDSRAYIDYVVSELFLFLWFENKNKKTSLMIR